MKKVIENRIKLNGVGCGGKAKPKT